MKEQMLYEKIVSKDLTWEGLIRDIVTNEGLDPWDIDVAAITNIFLKALRNLKQKDIRISGKFILAAAILLKMKADYLILKEEEEDETDTEETENLLPKNVDFDLEPHIPAPKKRKVTLDELIGSLKKALVVKERRKIRHKKREVTIKKNIKQVDIRKKIKSVYSKILGFFKKFKSKEITFSKLVPTKHRWDIIWTFIPVIHLANKDKIRIRQEKSFGEIYVREGKGKTKGSS